MAAKVQLFSGVDSVRAADQLRRAVQDRRDAWPYPHVYPPPNSKDVHVIGTSVTGAQSIPPGLGPGPQITVLTYQVQSGKRFYLKAILLTYVGGAFVPGDALFTIDRNSAVGSSNTQFLPEHGLVNIPVQLGSNLTVPWPLQRAREFEPLDVVRINAANVNLGVGDGNFYVCGLFGYELPVLDVRAGVR
jgi:hypothetical protein